jgi:DNA invertase Pin-like site-specific DNA recombinase
MPESTRAIAYLRCSTVRQDLSPDAQRAVINEWAANAGVEVAAWHEDLGVSGGADIDKRPGLLAAIDALREHGAGVLVVAKRDRLARDVLVSAMVERLCERAGARIQSADGTGNGAGPEAALMRNIVAAFSAYERMLIRARTKAALAVKKAKGQRVGGIPYGYRLAADGTHLEKDDAERIVVARARALREQGLSLRAVGRALLEEGHAPRRGKAWHVQVVARLTAATPA